MSCAAISIDNGRILLNQMSTYRCGVRKAGVPPSVDCRASRFRPAPALSVTAMGGARLPTMTTTTAAVVFQHRVFKVTASSVPGRSCSDDPACQPTTRLPNHHPLLMPTARLLAFASTALCGSALMEPFHPTACMAYPSVMLVRKARHSHFSPFG